MPARSKKLLSASQNEVPVMGDPERKRVLNVLAQRRYRERQRQKLNRVASRNGNGTVSPPASTSSKSSSHMISNTPSVTMPMSDSFYNDLPLFTDSLLQPLSTFDILSPTTYDVYTPDNGVSSPSISLPVYTPTEFSAELGELSGLELSQFTFPDSGHFEVPFVKLLNVGMTIAGLLRCADTLWDPTFTRTVTAADFSGSTLPANLLPTPIQGKVPHHPILDILPWPSVRTKLIAVFSQPLHIRPPIARDETGIMRLVQDIDDEAEGVRVSNDSGDDGDALTERSWEIGQVFYRNWWWALDAGLIERSNKLRRNRGARPLTLMPE